MACVGLVGPAELALESVLPGVERLQNVALAVASAVAVAAAADGVARVSGQDAVELREEVRAAARVRGGREPQRVLRCVSRLRFDANAA